MARATIKFSLKPGQCKTIAGTRVCNRWQRNTAQSGKDYTKGLRKPRRSWARETCNAQDCYKQGVDRAHSRGAFKRGVRNRGFVGFRKIVLRKGPTRFAQGVFGGSNAYGQGFSKYHSVIKRTVLPGRFPRGDPRNMIRCSFLAAALGRARVGKAVTGRVTCPDR